jgi:hypothetical protein
MKLDIEGMVFRVPKHFFDNASRGVWPWFIQFEYLQIHQVSAGGATCSWSPLSPRHH